MSQPPSQQTPGGFGAPGEPQPDPGPPQQPAAPDMPGPYDAASGPYQQQPQQPGPYDIPGTPPQPDPYGAPGAYPPPQQQPDPYSAYGAPGAYPPQQPQPPGPYEHHQHHHPQQPPAPYAAPGPYGAPSPYGGAPGPYTPGPVPTGQISYAYPGGPPPPPAPPNNGGSGKGGFFRGKRGVVVAASAAVLLVIGGGAWFVASGDDEAPAGTEKTAGRSKAPAPTGSGSDPAGGGDGADAQKAPGTDADADAEDGDPNAGRKDGEAKIAFIASNEVDLPRNGVDAFGPWVAGDTVVRAAYREVTGYSAADGRKKWTLPVPTEVCSATLQPSADGKIVVGVKDGPGEKAKCLDLRMIDLKTGKVGWKKTLRTGSGFSSITDFTLTISGGTLGAAGLGNSYGFSMKTGEQLFKGPVRGCKPFAFAGGSRLIAAAGCPTKDWNKPKQQIQELDPRTGRAKWTYRAPEGWEVEKVFSVDPVVVSLKQTQEKQWGVVALNADGTERSRIQGGKDKFQPRCGGAFVVMGENLEGCVGVAADRESFYMATQPKRPGGPNEVVAFDLDSGKARWRAPSGGDSTLVPLRMQDGRVLAYREPTWEKGGALVTIAPSGGAPKQLMRFQDAKAQTESAFYSSRLVYDDGRFFIASSRVSARNDAEELKTKTMMAFTE